MKLIKLTGTDFINEIDFSFWINSDHICELKIDEDEEYTAVKTMHNENYWLVRETPEQIIEMCETSQC